MRENHGEPKGFHPESGVGIVVGCLDVFFNTPRCLLLAALLSGELHSVGRQRYEPDAIMNKRAKKIVIREEYCIGCRLCEVHCITQHSGSKDIIKTYKGAGNMPVSGICFEEKGSVSFAIQCRHCDDAPCVENCLTGAMYRDAETGRILHNRDKCVGCWMCVMLCPFGVIKTDHAEKKVVSKCDLCIEGDFPACVEHCPNDAICLVDAAGRKIEK